MISEKPEVWTLKDMTEDEIAKSDGVLNLDLC